MGIELILADGQYIQNPEAKIFRLVNGDCVIYADETSEAIGAYAKGEWVSVFRTEYPAEWIGPCDESLRNVLPAFPSAGPTTESTCLGDGSSGTTSTSRAVSSASSCVYCRENPRSECPCCGGKIVPATESSSSCGSSEPSTQSVATNSSSSADMPDDIEVGCDVVCVKGSGPDGYHFPELVRGKTYAVRMKTQVDDQMYLSVDRLDRLYPASCFRKLVPTP